MDHIFTSEQMQKFLDATHCVGVKATSGEFTTKELHELVISSKGLSDWPEHTNDPRVNYAVDCVVDDDEVPYDEALYIEEIEAFKELKAT